MKDRRQTGDRQMFIPRGLWFSFNYIRDDPRHYSVSNHITLRELAQRVRAGQRIRIVTDRQYKRLEERAHEWHVDTRNRQETAK